MKPLHVLGLFILMLATSVTTVVVWTWIADKGNRQEVRVQREEPVPPSAPKAEPPPPKSTGTPKTESNHEAAALPKVNETKPTEESVVKPLTGKLIVKLVRDKAADCRIYVDGRIVGEAPGAWGNALTSSADERVKRAGGNYEADRQHNVFDLLLLPGEYKLELGTCLNYLDTQHIPFQWERPNRPYEFSAQTVKIEAGKTNTLELGGHWYAQQFGQFDRKDAEWGVVYEEAFDFLAKRVAGAREEYRSDPLVRALGALVGGVPARPAVWIDMPAELGGPREFDAAQVRHVVHYLKLKHWGWIASYTPRAYIGDLSPSLIDKTVAIKNEQIKIRRQALEMAVARLMEQVRAYERDVDGLNEIAAKLEKVKR